MNRDNGVAQWFAVRCLFAFGGLVPTGQEQMYEERITLWQAKDQHSAIERAEVEAEQYAAAIPEHPSVYLGFAQVFELGDPVRDGAEVFSLVRDSHLPPARYLTHFFDTGGEHQGIWNDPSA